MLNLVETPRLWQERRGELRAMLIRCREKDCEVKINPANDSLFDLTCGVPNCYLKQQMLSETKRRYSLAALCLVGAVAIFIVTSYLIWLGDMRNN